MGRRNRRQRPSPEASQQEMASWAAAEPEVGREYGVWEKFAEPRGWALKWDGVALSGVRDREAGSGRTP